MTSSVEPKIELLGTHHRGIDDAKNIARLMPYILGRKKINLEKQ